MWTDTYERLDTSKLTFVPHYKSTCSSSFMKMDCKSYKQAPVRECMSLSLCVGPPGCNWNMYAVSGSVEPLRIELGGRLLLMAATAAPQPSGSWKVLRYLWKFTAPFCTGHKKSEKKEMSSVKPLSCIDTDLHLFKWCAFMNLIRGYFSLKMVTGTCFTFILVCISPSFEIIIIIIMIQKELCLWRSWTHYAEGDCVNDLKKRNHIAGKQQWTDKA